MAEISKSARAAHDSALADFVRLAAALAGGSARIDMRSGTVAEAGAFGDDELVEHPIAYEGSGRGRLLATGPRAKDEAMSTLARRVAAYAEEHESPLEFAERANEVARAATRRFEAFFDGLPVACYACDTEGRLMEWNQAAEEIWGTTIVAGWGQEAAPIVDPVHPEAERDVLARVLEGKAVRDEEREVSLPSGERRWHFVSAFPLRNGEGAIVGVVGARLDITRRKQAESELAEREARFRTVFETLHEGLVVVDETGKEIFRNPSARAMLRLGEGAVDLAAEFPLGSVVDSMGTAVAFEAWPLGIALRTGQSVRNVLLGISRPGAPDPLWICVNAEPLPSGAVATFTDVTAQIRQERKIAEIRESLARLSPSEPASARA